MAKKAELLEQAKELKLEVTEKNTIAEIETAIKNAEQKPVEKEGTAKAGKRSEKALKAAEEKAEKEARKEAGDTSAQNDETPVLKKGPRPITRPKLERRGKKYKEVAKLLEVGKTYGISEAFELATKTSPTKFDASVEVHARLGVDPRQADQNIRATVSLPHGTGKTVRVAVFAPSDLHEAAKKAGADIVGEEDFLQILDKEQLNFDVLVSTPQFMPRLGKYARLLGPRGLMPNPKSGTVSNDVAKATSEAKAGKVEYRVDKQAIIHLGIGKVSFGGKKLSENAKVFLDNLQAAKPASLKGIYIKSITVTTTQGPGIKVDINSL